MSHTSLHNTEPNIYFLTILSNENLRFSASERRSLVAVSWKGSKQAVFKAEVEEKRKVEESEKLNKKCLLTHCVLGPGQIHVRIKVS